MNENFRNIITAALSGNESAYEALYTMTKDSAYFIALSMTHNEQDALDILQESYIRAFVHLDTVDPPEYFDNWLNRIVSNCSKNFIKLKKPMLFSDISENIHLEELNEETDSDLIPHENIDKQEASRLIMEIINELPENKRLVILMYYYQDMSTKEISETLELPLTTVKYYLLEGRKQIKAELEKLDKEGTRLYAIIPFALFPSFIKQAAENINAPVFSAVSLKIMNNVNAVKRIPQSIHPLPQPNTTTSTIVNGGENMFLKTTAFKIVAGVAAALVIGVGVTAVALTMHNNKKEPSALETAAESQNVSSKAAEESQNVLSENPADSSAATEPSVQESVTESQNVPQETPTDSSLEVTEPSVPKIAEESQNISSAVTEQSEQPEQSKQSQTENKTVSEDFYGSAIKTDDGLFYWKYSSNNFLTDAAIVYKISTVTQSLPNNVNQMICRGTDGKERVLFEKEGSGKFAFCNGKFFYNSRENVLYSCDIDGKNEKNLGYMKLENVTDDGAYLICSYIKDPNKENEGTEIDDIYTVNTLTEEKRTVVQSGGYVGYHNDLIYYYYKTSAGPQPYQFSGQIQIHSVNVDGTDDRILYTNDNNLYNDEIGRSYVGQIYFGDEYIYFSYGATTAAAQGAITVNSNGRIVRMKYDGSSAEIVAGASELVGPNFDVYDDGIVTATKLPQLIDFVPLDNVRAEDTSIYMINTKTGRWDNVIGPNDYSIIGGDPNGDDNCYTISDVDMVGDKLYYLVIYAEKIHQGLMGREMARRKACGFFEKDMTTGKVNVLYQF